MPIRPLTNPEREYLRQEVSRCRRAEMIDGALTPVQRKRLEAIRNRPAEERDVGRRISAGMSPSIRDPRSLSLTAGELRTLGHIADGLTNEEIAALEHVGHETIKSRVKKLIAKLDSRGRAHAACEAIRRGLIK